MTFAPVFGEGVPELGVDQFRQSRGIRLITDVPSLQPGEFGVGGAGTGLGHLGQTQVDGVCQNRAQKQHPVTGGSAALDVSEVTREARSFVHLH